MVVQLTSKLITHSWVLIVSRGQIAPSKMKNSVWPREISWSRLLNELFKIHQDERFFDCADDKLLVSKALIPVNSILFPIFFVGD